MGWICRAATGAYWLDFSCRHRAAVREKETGLFLRMLLGSMKRQDERCCSVPGICHNNQLSSNEEAAFFFLLSTNPELNSLTDKMFLINISTPNHKRVSVKQMLHVFHSIGDAVPPSPKVRKRAD